MRGACPYPTVLIDFNYDIQPVTGTFPLPAIGPLSLLKETRLNHFGKLTFKYIYWYMILPGLPIPLVASTIDPWGVVGRLEQKIRLVNLESSVERGGMCACGGAGQGARTRNSYSIARSCNAAMCRRKRAIRPVAALTRQVNLLWARLSLHLIGLGPARSGQLRILG